MQLNLWWGLKGPKNKQKVHLGDSCLSSALGYRGNSQHWKQKEGFYIA